MGCIYMWTNKVNGKRYVGKCHGNVKYRRQRHLKPSSRCVALKNAIAKYGEKNFTFEIIVDGVFDDFLNDYEIYYIKHYNTVSPNGYNLTMGGEGGKKSDETKRKMSESKKRQGIKPPSRAGCVAWNRGIPIPEEQKRKISDSKKHPMRDTVKSFYLTLPANMSASEKRKILRGEYSEINRRTIYRWVNEWRSEIK